MSSFILGTLKFVLWVAGALLIVCGILKIWYVDIIRVDNNGMAPTIVRGERIAVWRDTTPQHGDIALCDHPTQPGVKVIGRIVALPGTSLGTDMYKRLLISGSAPDKDYQGNVEFLDTEVNRRFQYAWGIEKLGNSEHQFFERRDRPMVLRTMPVVRGFFLLNDNRSHLGTDSRTFGPVPPANCRGRLFMRLQPAPEQPSEIGNSWLDLLD